MKTFLTSLFALALLALPGGAHTLQVEPIVVNLRAQSDALTAEFIGNVQDITQSVSVQDNEKRGNTFTDAVNQRTEAYFNSHFVLSQGGVPLKGVFQSLKQQGNLDPTRAKFTLFLRYPLTPGGSQKLQLKNTLLDYLPNARLVVTTDGFTRTLAYGDVVELDPSNLVKNLAQNIGQFIVLGAEHIFTGYDHMLFIVALLLLATSLKSLIKTLTGFTIAHSVTLVLAALQVVTPPAKLVEVMIPVSILYVGLENLWLLKHQAVEKAAKTRFWIATSFGLIHGFGFAGNLRDIGLPSGSAQFFCLFSFNVGVEVAQVILCAIAFPFLVYVRNDIQRRARHGGLSWDSVLNGASALVCLAGLYFLALSQGLL